MSWARYDDELPLNGKVGKLRAKGTDGIAALGLHLLANCYARHNGTAGVIEDHVPEILAGKSGGKLARLLAEVGMFDAHPDGWVIHDFEEFHDPSDPDPNRSAADRKRELSDKRREAGRRGGQQKASNRLASAGNALAEPNQTSSPEPEPEPDCVDVPNSPKSVGRTAASEAISLLIEHHIAIGKAHTPDGYRKTMHSVLKEQHRTEIVNYLLRRPAATGAELAYYVLYVPMDVAPFQSKAKQDWYADPFCETCGGDGYASREDERGSTIFGPCHCRRGEEYPGATIIELRPA